MCVYVCMYSIYIYIRLSVCAHSSDAFPFHYLASRLPPITSTGSSLSAALDEEDINDHGRVSVYTFACYGSSFSLSLSLSPFFVVFLSVFLCFLSVVISFFLCFLSVVISLLLCFCLSLFLSFFVFCLYPNLFSLFSVSHRSSLFPVLASSSATMTSSPFPLRKRHRRCT